MAAILTVFALLGCSLLAMHLGGEPERRGGQVFGCIVLLSTVRSYAIGAEAQHLDLPALSVDLFGFAAFTWIAVFAWRIWPLWASSLQLLALAAHLSRALAVPIHPLVYLLMRTAPTYLEVVVLLLGVWGYRRRKRKHGNMPSWRKWSGPLNRMAPTRWPSGSSRTSGR